ncbi:hypothetical protein NE237_022918 [Protea cynaroides]|uniref:Fungal lipase-type domain-containing protein n=1 Tax=Protea cynaroides TaxID=273540 RepID=A0A9Q0HG62_9MAGN|nr:hypothetical protein NE237_022918 [Protea cynaroides]
MEIMKAGDSSEERGTNTHREERLSYLILPPENGGILDLIRFLLPLVHYSDVGVADADKEFVEISQQESELLDNDHRWVILVSIIARKVIALLAKPMMLMGCFLEFFLNLLSLNGGLSGLVFNLLVPGKLVIPHRNSASFISTIGQLDKRVDLLSFPFPYSLQDNGNSNNKEEDYTSSTSNSWWTEVNREIGHGESSSLFQLGSRALMDLCVMATKLAYENANVVRSIVCNHWKMHFVDFCNCWNDYQKQKSTQVFILCDKPKDANLILISFRGTEPFDADDWSTDFDYSWYEIPKIGKVHMGFLEALGLGNRADATTFQMHLQENVQPLEYQLLSDDKMTAYYTVRSKLRILLQEHKNASFVLTGHSLGGALAILFPAVLLLHQEKALMQRLLGVYTFGQPRVGDKGLGSFVEAHVNHPIPRYFRVVYCNDLVPRLPYDDKTFLYKHFGLCLYYNSCYIEREMKEEPNRNYFGMRYLVPKYLNAVWELFRSLTMGYTYGLEYKEGWFCILFRVVGLAFPGISAHCLTNYVNSVRLGRGSIQMSSI